MRDDLRERFFTPFVLPLTIVGVLLLIGISLSRILLAVSELSAALVALLAAGYIMAIAFFVEARKRIPPRTLGVALAVGLLGLVAAGAAASAAGVREVEHAEEGGHGEPGEGGQAGGGTEPVWVAVDIEFTQAPEALPPGDTTVTLENEGAIEHNVVFEGIAGDEPIAEAPGGASDEGSVTLEPGEYVYYCSIPGHRTTMEGTLTVEEGAGEGAGGGAEASEAASEAGGAASEPASAAGEASEGGGASDAGASEAGASEPGAR
ncbi:MAG TPA: plastocyanin/azurin family copper-binding protein [Euzebyales bacterium]|nr:plastocyanin/azurin family copper-binding protein [Euzebyales bacterium]